MKIRTGFVSNSSSSSFLIYGTEVSESDFEDNMETWEKILDHNSSDFDDLSVFSRDDSFYIGRSWKNIDDDETGKQFKTMIEDAIERVAGKKMECETIEAAWYNG